MKVQWEVNIDCEKQTIVIHISPRIQIVIDLANATRMLTKDAVAIDTCPLGDEITHHYLWLLRTVADAELLKSNRNG